jgi:hypothetical protein
MEYVVNTGAASGMAALFGVFILGRPTVIFEFGPDCSLIYVSIQLLSKLRKFSIVHTKQ